MKCKEVNEINDMMSLYIDGELGDEEKLYFENHLKQCPMCKKEFEDYEKVINALHNIKEESPPDGYCERLHNKLVNEKSHNNSGKIRWIKYGSIAAALIIVFSIISTFPNFNIRMGNISKDDNLTANESASPSKSPESPEIGMSVGYDSKQNQSYSGSVDSGRDMNGNADVADVEKFELSMRTTLPENLENKELKIIKTGSIEVETEDYDKFIENIIEEINVLGGYLEQNNTQVMNVYENRELKYGNLIIRIPQLKFYDFVRFIEDSVKVNNKNILESDVTKEYYEKDNKVKNLELQEEHLRLLFDKANTVEEMLKIENELRRIRTEIDALNISLSDIDDRASMSKVDLKVNEVLRANIMSSRENVWDRARDGFINTINGLVQLVEDIIIWVISASPIIIPSLIILIIIFNKIRKKLN